MTTSIDLRQLRYFLAVSEELHFGRAAKRLHISQPPLSRQIRQLEDSLGVALFLRSQVGVSLTQAGRTFSPEVRRTLAQADKAIALARAAGAAENFAEHGGQRGVFVLGYTTVFDRSAIPDVLERMRERFPHWRLVSEGKHSISLVRAIKNGVMDAAFIGLHTDVQGLVVETIREEPLLLALPASHALAKKRRVAAADLQGEPLFWFQRRLNPGYYDYCQAFFKKIHFQPHVIPEPLDHHILLGLIAEEKGCALIPASMQKIKRQGVVYRALKEEFKPLTAGIAVAYSAGNPSPALQPFLEMVREVVSMDEGVN